MSMLFGSNNVKLLLINVYKPKYSSIRTSSTDHVKTWKDIPGPSSLPFLGQLHHFLPGGSLYKKTGRKLWHQLFTNFGPIVRLETALKPPKLILFDPDSIAKVSHSENWMPMRPSFPTLKYYRNQYNRTKEQLLKPTGLATDQGETWKTLRAKVSPAMLIPKIVKLYSKVIDEVALDMVNRIRSFRGDKNYIIQNFGKEMNIWSLESIAVIALGGRINCLDPNLDELSPAMQLIRNTHELFEISAILDQEIIWEYYPTKSFKKAMKIYEELEIATKFFVQNALREYESKKNTDSNNEKSVLEKLLELDEEIAHLMACDMLIAGVDTTSNTMLSTLYLLATNPEKQQTLRDEVTSSSDENRPYLKACIKESIRILPVVGLNARETTKEYNLMGYNIPKRMFLLFCNEYMANMDCYYPKANEYHPERWIVDKSHPLYYGNAHPFVAMPFGFGVRSCIGQRIAELELEIFLSRVIQNFHVEWSGPPPKIKANFVNYVSAPYNFTFNEL